MPEKAKCGISLLTFNRIAVNDRSSDTLSRLLKPVSMSIALSLLFGLLAVTAISVHPAFAQRKKSVTPKPPKEKRDELVLRYKPQVGTLLYDVRTNITQHVRSGTDDLTGSLGSSAQLAFHNVSVDYKSGLWSFDRYFTSFHVFGRQLTGDSLYLRENFAANRITRVTYKMTGEEVASHIIDTLQLQNTEAQTNFYFFQPPRMLIPLPQKSVTYGDTWFDHRRDTVHVHDTINIGITTGAYFYDVSRTYRLAALQDTMQQYLAIIVAVDSGYFEGSQNNTVTGVDVKSRGPITGADTTFLDLFSGRVVRRTSRLLIPTVVEISGNPPFTDAMDVRSVVVLNESNAYSLHKEQSGADAQGTTNPQPAPSSDSTRTTDPSKHP